jgi:hypothetical protein
MACAVGLAGTSGSAATEERRRERRRRTDRGTVGGVLELMVQKGKFLSCKFDDFQGGKIKIQIAEDPGNKYFPYTNIAKAARTQGTQSFNNSGCLTMPASGTHFVTPQIFRSG